jgi:hypothetical protein
MHLRRSPLQAAISVRVSRLSMLFACAGRYHPVRKICAIPRASFQSALLRITARAGLCAPGLKTTT